MSNFIQRLFGRIDANDIISMKQARNTEGLIKALNYQQDAFMRGLAAEALVDLNEAQAHEHLIKFLEIETDPACFGSFRYLAKLGNTQLVDVCIKRLQKKDTDREVLKTLISILTEQKDKHATKALLPLLKSEMRVSGYQNPRADLETRTLAAKALGNIGDSSAVEPLIELLEPKGIIAWWSSEQDNWSVRAVAAEALGKIGDLRAVQELVQVRRGLYYEKPSHHETRIELAAKKALLLIGTPALKTLFALTSDSVLAASALEIIHEILLSSIESIPTHDLEEVAKLNKIHQEWQDNWSGDSEWKTYSGTDEIDCSHVRQLAEEELQRRKLKVMQ